jgi:hypothetical protein
MLNAEQQFKIAIEKKIMNQIFSQSTLRVAFEGVAKKAIDIMRKRISDGYDIYGRHFGGYNRSYNKARAMRRLQGKTEYAATSVKDYLRLSGELFSDMKFQVKGINQSSTSILGEIRLYIAPRSQQKAMGLMSETGVARNHRTYSKKSWDFLGLSVSGPRVASERKQLEEVFMKILSKNLSIKYRLAA